MSNSVVYQTQMTRMLHFINFDCILILYMSVKCVNMYKPNNKREIREIMKKYFHFYLQNINKWRFPTVVYSIYAKVV